MGKSKKLFVWFGDTFHHFFLRKDILLRQKIFNATSVAILLLAAYLLVSCSSIDQRFVDAMIRTNGDIRKAHTEDIEKAPGFLEIKTTKGEVYYNDLLRDLLFAEEAQLNEIKAFQEKEGLKNE